jgi:PKD repeat protein
MRTILIFISLLLTLNGFTQEISKAEYFFNTDPGYGNGTAVAVSPGDLVDINFNANISGLSSGIHTLYVRVKSGVWSQLSKQIIAISEDEGLSEAEYFFDEDPGFGNGTAIPVNPGKVVELNFDADISGLAPGIHTLYIRVKAGAWSEAYPRTVGITPDEGIYTAEYFFDEDPGFGNGTALTVTPGKVINLDFNADLTNLAPGIHRLYLRVKSGVWSQVYSRTIGVTPDEGIYTAEYFFDEDPGFGNGTTVDVTPGKVIELNFDADISNLSPGVHKLYLRLEGGMWGQVYSRIVGISPETGITAAEYFLGEDPGEGNGVPIEITPGKMVLIDDVIEDLNFPNGMNYITFRVFGGKWSLPYMHEFCQNPIPDFETDFAEFGNPTTFTDLSQQTNDSTGYAWDVDNDGIFDYFDTDNFLHLYEAPGSYDAKLVLESQGGCKDSIIHEVLVYACMAPTELSATDITWESAVLDWTPGNFGNRWEILYGYQGFDTTTAGILIQNVNEHPFTLTGLEPETDYDFYVRTICDGPEVSEWSGPQAFTTLEYICAPEWEVSPYYQYNMQVVGKLYIDGEQSFDPNDKVGAFIAGECRGIAAPDPDLFGLVFLSIGSDELTGDMVTFKIWDVDACEECPVAQNMIFENQIQVGTPSSPYPFECGVNELELNFGEGYTWFSANINPGTMEPNDLFSALQPCGDDRIIGQNSFAIYYDEAWIGSLTEIIPGSMHKMELCSQQSLTIEGMPVENETLLLGDGYTWLGYLPQGQLSVNDALAPLNPAAAEDDRLLGQNSFAVYFQGQWIGSLKNMNPGNGFIIELSQESLLTYPDAVADDGDEMPPEELFNPLDETPLAYRQHTMMIIAQLELPDGSISQNPEDVVYAYSGNECRGIASPDPENNGLIFMSVGSDVQVGEEITFRAWLGELQMPVDIRETIGFESLKKAGTMAQPELFTLKGFTGTGELLSEGIYIGEPFPNPFNETTEISYRLNETARVKLTLYNSHGQILRIDTDAIKHPGAHKVTIHREGLQAGVYFYRIEIFIDGVAEQKHGKIIIH